MNAPFKRNVLELGCTAPARRRPHGAPQPLVLPKGGSSSSHVCFHNCLDKTKALCQKWMRNLHLYFFRRHHLELWKGLSSHLLRQPCQLGKPIAKPRFSRDPATPLLGDKKVYPCTCCYQFGGSNDKDDKCTGKLFIMFIFVDFHSTYLRDGEM
jgi:hypothetical protein